MTPNHRIRMVSGVDNRLSKGISTTDVKRGKRGNPSPLHSRGTTVIDRGTMTLHDIGTGTETFIREVTRGVNSNGRQLPVAGTEKV